MANTIRASIYDASKFLYVFLKFLGHAPYSFCKKSRKLKVNARNILQIILSLSIWIALLRIKSVQFQGSYESTGVQSTLLSGLWQSQYLLQFYLAIIILIINVWKRNHIGNFLHLILNFDEALVRHNWKFKNENFRPTTIFIALLSSTLLISVYGVLTFYFQLPTLSLLDVGKIIAYVAASELFLIVSLQFILSTYCVYARLKVLKQNFRFLLPSNEVDVIPNRLHLAKADEVVKCSAILYDKLANATDEINSIFSMEMIAVFTISLILEIFVSYLAIKIFTGNYLMNPWSVCDFGSWILYFVVPSIAAIHVGSIANQEGKSLANAVSEYSNNCNDEKTLQRLNSLMNKLNSRPIILSCRLFNIDWSLGFSLIGTIATYMIIICQFEKDL